jgi:thioredoxin 1
MELDIIGRFEQEIASGLVLVDFATVRCEPCKQLDALLPILRTQYGHKIKIIKIDADQQELLVTYAILHFPTVLLFKNGQEIQRRKGVKTKEVYQDAIEYWLTYTPIQINNDHELYDISML